MKREGIEYDERMELLEEVTLPEAARGAARAGVRGVRVEPAVGARLRAVAEVGRARHVRARDVVRRARSRSTSSPAARGWCCATSATPTARSARRCPTRRRPRTCSTSSRGSASSCARSTRAWSTSGRRSINPVADPTGAGRAARAAVGAHEPPGVPRAGAQRAVPPRAARRAAEATTSSPRSIPTSTGRPRSTRTSTSTTRSAPAVRRGRRASSTIDETDAAASGVWRVEQIIDDPDGRPRLAHPRRGRPRRLGGGTAIVASRGAACRDRPRSLRLLSSRRIVRCRMPAPSLRRWRTRRRS